MLEDVFRRGVVIVDGAMGSLVRQRSKAPLPYEALNLTQPATIARIHTDYLRAGARVIRTNSFGANRIALARYHLEDQVAAVNQAAVALARQAVEDSGAGSSAVVAGTIGAIPQAIASSSGLTWSLEATYAQQAGALIDAGAEMLICETFQTSEDVSQALAAIMPQSRKSGLKVPVAVCVSPPDDSLQAADFAAEIYEIAVRTSGVSLFGFNCGFGPRSIADAIVNLHGRVRMPVLALPSAGIPIVRGESLHYPVSVEEFASSLTNLAGRKLVAGVGGCCGTTPDYISALAAELSWRRTN